MSKIGRNDPCHCGSGRKYKACCFRSSQEEKLPFGAILHEMNKASKLELCMHPAASAEICGKIIKAHTIQRSRVLEALCDSDHKVMTFHPSKAGSFDVKLIGWREASTFKAFCDQHDGPTFAALETTAFTGSLEQIFLTAYRGLCWEIYQKERALKGAESLRANLRKGVEPQIWMEIAKVLTTQDKGYEKGLQELWRIKPAMDADLIAQNYASYSYAEFILSGPPFIAAAGSITPNYSLSGKGLQKLDMYSSLEPLTFGINVSAQGSHFIFCWNSADTAPSKYMTEILALSPDKIASFLCQFCFMHCENTYFSKSWWMSLSISNQNHVSSLMNNTNPYAKTPPYQLDVMLAPWTLSSYNHNL
ncbi:MAG: SEC-C metal-binding domain-containing protein [Verrucomicrobiota bacterium]